MSNRRRQIDVNNLFIEIYRAFPANIMGRDEIDPTNNVILPPSALKKLSCMKNFGDTKNPILFRILNIQLNIYTHCGVFDFTAEEGTCYLPANMFDRLCLEEGHKVNLRALTLNPGTFIKIQPQKTDFIKIPEPKKVLEYNLRNYFCVTEGDTISIKFCGRSYKIDILECKPDKAIRTLNCDLVVDFAPPKDYKEPEPKKPINNVTGSNIKFNSEEKPVKLTKEEIEKNITDKKFSGHHFRMDGKEISQKVARNVIEAKKEKEKAEDNYDPRKCRIPSNPRPEFKYVEL